MNAKIEEDWEISKLFRPREDPCNYNSNMSKYED